MGEERRVGVVVLPDEARVIDLGGFVVSVRADGAMTQDQFSLLETTEADAGAGPPLHIHHDCAESFFVLAGSYLMHIDGEQFRCPPGSFVHVPRGVVHTFQAAEAGARKLNLYTPAGMVAYFDELAAALATGVDADGLDAITARSRMEVVGPVPEGYL